MVLIAPSILSADFWNLGKQIIMIQKANADLIHFDVMDGHFVSEITFGQVILRRLVDSHSLPLDVHLMVRDPFKQIDSFIEAGASILTIHWEAMVGLDRDFFEFYAKCQAAGVEVGLAINPATPADMLTPWLDKLDLVLVMTVEPGKANQLFMANLMSKLDWLVQERQKNGYDYKISVDGGIKIEPDNTAKIAVVHGADILVAGSAIFQAQNPKKVIEQMKQL